MIRHVETVAASTIKLQFTCEFFGPGSTKNSILLSMQMAWIGRPLMFIFIMKLNLLIILIISVVNFFRWYRNGTCFRSQINFHAHATRNFTYSTHKNRSKLSNNFLKVLAKLWHHDFSPLFVIWLFCWAPAGLGHQRKLLKLGECRVIYFQVTIISKPILNKYDEYLPHAFCREIAEEMTRKLIKSSRRLRLHIYDHNRNWFSNFKTVKFKNGAI